MLAVVWLVLSVPIGGAVLAIKESLGWNIFTFTGYHSFEKCLAKESAKAFQK